MCVGLATCTQVPLVKVADSTAVVLYLPKELDLKVVAGAWENQIDDLKHNSNGVAYAGDDKRVVIVSLTPAQLQTVRNKTIDLSQKKVRLHKYLAYVI
jgi:hypothetical protein